jgi:hypothetical protein
MTEPSPATSCPKCGAAPVASAPATRRCARCGLLHTLYLGHASSPAVTPPPARPGELKSKSSGWLLRKVSVVGPGGIAHGTLDPVTGHIPMDTLGITWEDVLSITTWQRRDWLLFALTTVFILPLALLTSAGVIEGAGWLILAVPFVALTVFYYWRALGVGAWHMRVVGSRLWFSFRHDAPFYRRRRFLTEALSRAGITSEK